MRHSDYPIFDLFLRRWSPRSFTGEDLPHDQLMSLFEAARWAPSSGNQQPWRFLYAKRGSAFWPTYLDLLAPGNRVWCEKASALVVILSKTISDYTGKPSRTHSFDSGAAWENLALQACYQGLAAHGMEGFDYDKAREQLGIPLDFQVEAMIAIGRQAPPDQLPEKLREREFPNDRKPLGEFVFEGRFPTGP